MCRPTSTGIDNVQQGQLACYVIDCKGADAACLPPLIVADLIHGVEVPVGRVERQEARIVGFCGEAQRCELSRGFGELVNVDPLALRTGVGTDIDVVVGLAGSCVGATGVNNTDGGGEELRSRKWWSGLCFSCPR